MVMTYKGDFGYHGMERCHKPVLVYFGYRNNMQGLLGAHSWRAELFGGIVTWKDCVWYIEVQGLLLGVVAVTDWLWKHIGLLWILCSRQGCFGCCMADIQGLLWVLCGRRTRVAVGIIWQIYRGYCGFHVAEAYRYFGYYVADIQVLLWVLYDRHTGLTLGIMWQTCNGYCGYYMTNILGLLWVLCGRGIQGLLWVLCGRHARVTVGIMWQRYKGYCGYYVADIQRLLWVLYGRHTWVVALAVMWQT